MKKKLAFALRLLISLVSIAGLVYVLRGKLGDAFLIIKEGLRWEWFLLALIVFFLGLWVISRRFQLVLRVQGVKVSFHQAFYLSFLGMFFNLFFPSSLGGDVAKGYFAYEYSGKKLGSLTGVILDRLLGFATIVVVVLAALGFYSQDLATPLVRRSIYGIFGVLVVGGVLFANEGFAKKFKFLSFLIPSKKWRQKVVDFYYALGSFKNHKELFFSSVGLSFVAQFLFFFSVFLLARSIGIVASLGVFCLLMPLVFFTSMAPSISGLGVREAGFIFFFKPLMGAEKAFALSLLYDFVIYGTSLAAGLVFALKGGLRRELIHDLETAEKLPEVGHGGEM